MSAEEWSAVPKAGIENMSQETSHLSNQTDFLPTSSQSPGSSPQPSPDSQQKDLGASLPSQLHAQAQTSQPYKSTVSQHLHFSEQQKLSSQQDRHVSQSDFVTSQSPSFHESPLSVSSGQDTKTHQTNLSLSQRGTGGTSHFPSQSVPKALQPSHRQPPPCGVGPNAGHQMHHKMQMSQQGFPLPRQVSPQRPSFKSNLPMHHPQKARMPTQSNINPRTQAIAQQRLPGPAVSNFSKGAQNTFSEHQQQQQHLPQPQQKVSPSQYQQPPKVSGGDAQQMGQSQGMMSSDFNPQKQQQQQLHQKQHLRLQSAQGPSVPNRPVALHPVQKGKHKASFFTSNPSSQHERTQVFQSMNTHDTHGGHGDGDGSYVDMLPEQEMYDEDDDDDDDDFEAGLQEGEMFSGKFEDEDEEDEEEEDYDEAMEDEQYSYSGPPYGYDSSGSDDLSEEESALFEELTHLDRKDPRYEEIVNRLREKGVDREEIEEIINPQRPDYFQMYGTEEYDENEDKDAEREEEEGTVSSSSFNQGERYGQLRGGQVGTDVHDRLPHSSLQQQPQHQSSTVAIQSRQSIKRPTDQQFKSHIQPRQSLPHRGQASQQQQNMLQTVHNQQQQSFQKSSLQKHSQKQVLHSHQQHPAQSPNASVPSPAHISQRQQNWQQQQPKMAVTVSKLNQPKKVFQSPIQSNSSAEVSEPSGWQQQQMSFPSSQQEMHRLPRPPVPIKSSSNIANCQQQGKNSPRQVAPNRLIAPGNPPGQNQATPLVNMSKGPTLQNQGPTQPMAPSQGGAVQQLQQGATIQPPMVRAVVPRVMLLQQRMVRSSGPPSQVGHRPQLRNLRPRAVALSSPLLQNPFEQARTHAPINQASQSRLDVQHMQEMLDKQIQAKKGAAALSGSNAEDQFNITRSAPPRVFQTPQQRHLPPRQPVSTAWSMVRQPNMVAKQPVAPVGAPPGYSKSIGAVRPRNSSPMSLHRVPFSQQSSLASQTRMTPSLQTAQPGHVSGQGKPAVLPQGSPGAGAEPSKTAVESPQSTLPSSQTSSLNPKHPLFDLAAVKEDKCAVSSHDGKRQGLIPNRVYRIKSPIDQTMVIAMWTGEKFERITPETSKGISQVTTTSNVLLQQASIPQDKIQDNASVGLKPKTNQGSGNAFQEQFLQSLQASHAVQPESSHNPDASGSNGEDQSSQSDRPDVAQEKILQSPPVNSSTPTTYVKPLSQGPAQQKKSDEDDENEDDDSIFKKPFSENDDVFRVCNNCGYTSKNFKRCDGCKKLFQGEVKIHCIKKTSATPASEPSTSVGSSSAKQMKPSDRFREVMSKATFYGTKDTSRGRGRGVVTARRGLGRTKGGGWKGKVDLQAEEEPDHHSSDEDSDDKRGVKRRPGRPKAKTTAPRKRSKKTDEPVTVTISSDEDEPSSTSNILSGFSASPAHSAGSESPIFTTTHMNPVTAFGRFRRVRMEDEEGNSKLQKKLQETRSEPSAMETGEEDLEEDEDGDDPAVYQIDIRSVRIGSMRTQPEEPMLISLHGVCFKCRSERTEEDFECEILCQEVEHVKFFAGQPQPVLFLFLSQECGEKLRSICHMEPGDEEYFDPSSTDMKQKMVVIIIESFNEMPLEMLRENLTLWADMNQQEDQDYLEELSEESANDLLIQSAPPVLTADMERNVLKFKKKYIHEGDMPLVQPRETASPPESMDNEEPDSTSSSPPDMRHHFFGTPIRLLLYPPPPARGISITTEDLMCLTEGEFLNDVVIDFYLQYLYKEKLSEENQKRTHIFSSFFYKRLTQRDRHSEKTEEDAKKSLPERRHARVQKWTKTVDLFSKDFIIVPINE
ncbi:sentrin-specific protease 6, partial [Plakobranchus ocellatus]